MNKLGIIFVNKYYPLKNNYEKETHMAKSKLGKFIAFSAAVAAIGGTCYVFRDKIKESELFQTITGKLANLTNKDDDFTFDDDEFDDDDLFSTDAKNNREYTSITITSEDDDAIPSESDTSEENMVADTPSAIQEPTSDVEDIVVNPTFTFDSQNSTEKEASVNTTVESYENEGLSDVYEDPDALEEQDKLDF